MVAAYWCFIFFIFFLYLLVKNQQKKNKNNPPSPRSLPLLGHLHLIKEPLHQTLETLSSKYGDILLLRFGLKKVLVICSPSAIEECFTRNDTVFANRPVSMATIHLSYDFTTMTVAPYGDLWRNLRRLAALEIFSPNRIAFFTDIRDNEIMLLINQLVKKCQGGGEKVELKTTFNELAFNILSMTIGGRRYYGENVEDAEEARNVRYVMREMLDISVNSNVGDLFPVLRWFDYGGVEKKMKDIMRRLDVFLQDLIDKRRGDRLVDDSDDDEDRTEHRKNWKKKNMVDHLLLLQDSEPENYPDKIIKGIILLSWQSSN
uniref:Cytochrome P450 n=1 Tax=Daucus carota subsp. sativus TaxID=79200 RepID=A0A165ZIW5_DAUCS